MSEDIVNFFMKVSSKLTFVSFYKVGLNESSECNELSESSECYELSESSECYEVSELSESHELFCVILQSRKSRRRAPHSTCMFVKYISFARKHKFLQSGVYRRFTWEF